MMKCLEGRGWASSLSNSEVNLTIDVYIQQINVRLGGPVRLVIGL